MTNPEVTVDRHHPVTNHGTSPFKQGIDLGDQVSWKINDFVMGETLVVESPYSSILPTSSSGSDTVSVTPSFTPGKFRFELPYTIYIDNGSRKPVADGFLVIDTNGPPSTSHPRRHPHLGDDGKGSDCRDPHGPKEERHPKPEYQ